MLEINEARKQLKGLGYKLSVKSNPFNPDLKTFYFSGNGIDKPFLYGNVMSQEFYNEHKAVIDILNNTNKRLID